MALVKCPRCGKQISDTSESCIHCGTRLTVNPEDNSLVQLTSYSTLSASEKANLKTQFYNVYPNYAKYENKEAKVKTLNKISWLCIFVGLGLAFLMMAGDNAFFLAIGVIGLIIFFVSDVIDVICPFLARYYKKKYLVAQKKYQKWLKDEKCINYVVTFNEKEKKWKKYFDEINVEIGNN